MRSISNSQRLWTPLLLVGVTSVEKESVQYPIHTSMTIGTIYITEAAYVLLESTTSVNSDDKVLFIVVVVVVVVLSGGRYDGRISLSD